MTIERKFALFLTTLILAIGGCGFCAYRGIQEQYSIRTAKDARPQDISFLHLPQTASHIGYWRDGINYWAEFNIPENDFRRLFREFQFREITEPLTVYPKAFGDPAVSLPYTRTAPVIVLMGLIYNESWSNGGGYNIVFDRSRSQAYYDFAKR